MRFTKHYEVEGLHAFLGASKHHWTEYEAEKMERIWDNQYAAAHGVRLHALAKELIELKHRQQRNNKTLNAYVNDAIGFRMTPEVVFKYSENAFGTADAASFEKGIFRVHDLKTGVHPASFKQLMIYCAYFCLEYRINPFEIEMIMRIYQSDQVFEEVADPLKIKDIMDTAQKFDKLIEKKKEVNL